MHFRIDLKNNVSYNDGWMADHDLSRPSGARSEVKLHVPPTNHRILSGVKNGKDHGEINKAKKLSDRSILLFPNGKARPLTRTFSKCAVSWLAARMAQSRYQLCLHVRQRRRAAYRSLLTK